MRLVLLGDPRTKKNSQRIVIAGSRRMIKPSRAYEQYEADCLLQIKRPFSPIVQPVNVKCVYYMATSRKVDLANLLEATDDILVKAGVLADDNSRIIISHDGSRVRYDKDNPRVEVEIESAVLWVP